MTQLSRAALKEFFKSGSKAVNRQYEDLIDSIYGIGDNISPILPTKFGKLLLVDPSALPGEGARGNINKPFPNPNDARLAALDGDIILIFPGSYNCTNLFKAGISYLALPGVTITTVDVVIPLISALFEDQSTPAGVCRFLGKAKLVSQNNSNLINLNSASTEIYIECEEIESYASAGQPVIGISSASRLDIQARIIKNHDSGFVLANPNPDFIFNITASEVEHDATVSFINMQRGHLNAVIEKLTANGYIADNELFDISLAGKHKISNSTIYTNTTRLISSSINKASIFLENIRYITSTDFATSYGVIDSFPLRTPINIPVSTQPEYAVAVPGGNIFVPHRGGTDIAVINPSTDTVIANIALGYSTNQAIYVPQTGYVYAGGVWGAAALAVIDPASNTLVTSISVGSSNFYQVFCPLNNYIYTVDADYAVVYAVDTATNTVVATIPTGGADPFQIIFVPATNKLYLVDSSAGLLSVIDPLTNTLVANYFLGYDIRKVLYVSTNGYLYITSPAYGQLFVFNTATNTLVTSFYVGTGAFESCFCPLNNYVYIPCNNSGYIRVIDTVTNMVVATIFNGAGPVYCFYNSYDGNIYVSNITGGNVSVIDPAINQIIAVITTESSPRMPVFSDVSSKIYVPNQGSNSVTSLFPPADLGKIVVKNCEFLETGTASGAKSVQGNGNVVILGTLNTNMPKDPAVNVQVGELNYDTNLTA